MTDVNPRLDSHDLIQKWGLVAERTSDQKLREAIGLILGYEADRLDLSPRLDLPSDIAHAQLAFESGKEHGLDLAMLALTDSDYINEQRGLLEDRLETLKKEMTEDV